MKRKAGRPSQEDAEALHHRIIVAATAEFVAHGYFKANMDRIARDARTTKQSIYRHYAGKDALFKSVIGDAIRERVGNSLDASVDAKLPRDVLRSAAMLIRSGKDADVLRGLRNAIMDVRDTFPDLHVEALDAINQSSIAVQLGAYFERLCDRGVLCMERPHTAGFDFAILVGSLTEEMGLVGDDFSAATRVDEVIGLFLRGYAAEAG